MLEMIKNNKLMQFFHYLTYKINKCHNYLIQNYLD